MNKFSWCSSILTKKQMQRGGWERQYSLKQKLLQSCEVFPLCAKLSTAGCGTIIILKKLQSVGAVKSLQTLVIKFFWLNFCSKTKQVCLQSANQSSLSQWVNHVKWCRSKHYNVIIFWHFWGYYAQTLYKLNKPV